MRHWFQNLKKEDKDKRWFHFRGSVYFGEKERRSFDYSFASGPALSLKYTHGSGDEYKSLIVIGALFFTMYFTFYLPKRFYFQKKCIATWDKENPNREFYLCQGRKFGFYLYDWAFVWSFYEKEHESSTRDPWWMSQYIHIDEIFLGKMEAIKDDLQSEENIYFMLGDKEFKMDSISWHRWRRFRRFIPYSLYHKTTLSLELKITRPPVRAGKGENSWDCGDDGTYGMSTHWPHPIPGWTNRDAHIKQAIEIYVESVMRDVKRYGRSRDPRRGVAREDVFKYIGRRVDSPIAQIVAPV